jgi:ABC-type uncharacterized transport system auxiliary subunit
MRLSDCSNLGEGVLAEATRARRVIEGVCLAALALAALSGCGSIKPVRYYTLTHPPTSSLGGAQQAPLDVTLLVRLFQTSHLYREDRIVYGGDTVQLGLYENDRWTEPPVELLQDALARGLRSSGSFRAVTTLRSDASAEYCLMGQLYTFREVASGGGGIIGRLNYDVELVDLKRGKALWRHRYNHDEPVAGKSVADVVAALDKNVQQSVQEVQDGVVRELSSYTRK